MYVCLCKALTDRQVKQAAAEAGTTKRSTNELTAVEYGDR